MTLINSVLDAMPTYITSLFTLPGSVLKKLDSIRRNLWQGNGEGGSKYHLVKWYVVTNSEKEGTMGTKHLKVQNQSLHVKWLWRFASGEQGL